MDNKCEQSLMQVDEPQLMPMPEYFIPMQFSYKSSHIFIRSCYPAYYKTLFDALFVEQLDSFLPIMQMTHHTNRTWKKYWTHFLTSLQIYFQCHGLLKDNQNFSWKLVLLWIFRTLWLFSISKRTKSVLKCPSLSWASMSSNFLFWNSDYERRLSYLNFLYP